MTLEKVLKAGYAIDQAQQVAADYGLPANLQGKLIQIMGVIARNVPVDDTQVTAEARGRSEQRCGAYNHAVGGVCG